MDVGVEDDDDAGSSEKNAADEGVEFEGYYRTGFKVIPEEDLVGWVFWGAAAADEGEEVGAREHGGVGDAVGEVAGYVEGAGVGGIDC